MDWRGVERTKGECQKQRVRKEANCSTFLHTLSPTVLQLRTCFISASHFFSFFLTFRIQNRAFFLPYIHSYTLFSSPCCNEHPFQFLLFCLALCTTEHPFSVAKSCCYFTGTQTHTRFASTSPLLFRSFLSFVHLLSFCTTRRRFSFAVRRVSWR